MLIDKVTIGEILDRNANEFPDEDALAFVDQNKWPIRYTWYQLKLACNRIAKGLMALGIEKGDHIAILATNHPEWVVLQLACAKIGAVLVAINPACKTSELQYLLEQSDSKAVVLISKFKTSDYISMLNKIYQSLNKLKDIIVIGYEYSTANFHYYLWAEIERMGKQISTKRLIERQNSLDCNDVTNILYTSGTTGSPKGAMLTHFGTLNDAYCLTQNIQLTQKDRVCAFVPLSHAFGCHVVVLGCLVRGAAMIFPSEYFDAKKALEAIEKEKCTVLYGVPTMLIAKLDHPDFDKFDLSSLRTGIMGGSPCPVEIVKKIMTIAKGMSIGYGLTETSPLLTLMNIDDPLEKRLTTVGKALPHAEIKIVNPNTNREVPIGEQGEVCAKGIFVTKGYYNMPEATKEAVDEDGWFHTGDLGTVDKDGYYKITGRSKDMIIRGGENIYPVEIEEFLFTHPKISDVQVVGLPDEKFGEEVVACIKLKEGVALTEEEIKAFCKDKISYYKIPKHVLFMAEFPQTDSGKIQKFKLREIAKEKLL